MAITPRIVKYQIERDPTKNYAISADTIYIDSTTTVKQYVQNFTNQAITQIMYDSTTTLGQYLNNLQNYINNLNANQIKYDSTTTVKQYLQNLDATQISYNNGNLDAFLDTINLTPGNINTSQISHNNVILKNYLDDLDVNEVKYDSTSTLKQFLDLITGPNSNLPVDYISKSTLQDESPYSFKIEYFYNNFVNDILFNIEDITSTNRRYIICVYNDYFNSNNKMLSTYTIYNNQTRVETFEYTNNTTNSDIRVREIQLYNNITLPTTLPPNPQTLSTPIGTQPVNRRFHTMSRVYNHLFIIGGDDGVIYHKLRDCHLYNPLLSRWIRQRSMPIGRVQHTATVVNHMIYVIGGYGGAPGEPETYLNDVLMYHHFDNQWFNINITSPKPAPRMGHVCVAIGNKIYLHGGFNGVQYFDDLWVFDTTNNTWTHIDATVKPSPRSDHNAIVYNGEIYFFNGTRFHNNTHIFYNDVWKFNPTNNQFTQITNATNPSPRASATITLHNNKAYMLGGYDLNSYKNNFVIFDFTANNNHFSIQTTPLVPISDHAAEKINNKLFIFGGYSLTNGYLNKFNVYDFDTNSWQDITI